MEAIQQAAAVLIVLGLLGVALFWLRNKGLVRFGANGIGRAGNRRMQSLERLQLTPHHSLHRINVGGRVLLIAVSPGGCSVVDGSEREVPADHEGMPR